MAIDVFLSVGRTATLEQEQFVAAVEELLRDHDLTPRTLGRNEWSSLQPLDAIRSRMADCSGTAIVAFERIRVIDGIEARGGEREKQLEDEIYPTVWNQVEAAMAHTLGHPLLVIAEDGLRSEGLLESRYEWMVQWLPLNPESLRSRECLGIIADWEARIEDFAEQRQGSEDQEGRRDLDEKTIGELLGELKPGQARAVVAAVIGVLGAAFAAGSQLG